MFAHGQDCNLSAVVMANVMASGVTPMKAKFQIPGEFCQCEGTTLVVTDGEPSCAWMTNA